MAKRRITLTSQEMNELEAKLQLLQTQLKRSNDRVEGLEKDLGDIKKLVSKKTKRKDVDALCEELLELVGLAINPPVKAKLAMEAAAAELAAEA